MALSKSQYKKLLKQKRKEEFDKMFFSLAKRVKSPKKGYMVEAKGETFIRLRRMV